MAPASLRARLDQLPGLGELAAGTGGTVAGVPAGAVGLMQVMPFWPERLGMRRYELTHIDSNIRMGCAILRFYLKYERNDVARALARYNGSVGRRDYPDLVISQWSRWNGADDLGSTKDNRPLPPPGSMRTTPSRRESAPPS